MKWSGTAAAYAVRTTRTWLLREAWICWFFSFPKTSATVRFEDWEQKEDGFILCSSLELNFQVTAPVLKSRLLVAEFLQCVYLFTWPKCVSCILFGFGVFNSYNLCKREQIKTALFSTQIVKLLTQTITTINLCSIVKLIELWHALCGVGAPTSPSLWLPW